MKSHKEFKLIECWGTPYEIGRQWGEGCKESILKISDNSFNVMSLMYQAPKEEVIAHAMRFLPLVQKFDPYLIEIMRGQADGAGVNFEEIITQKCMNELLFRYNNITGLCTSFAVTGKATKDGKTILGQNIDFFPGSPIDLLKIHHSTGLVQYILSFSNSTEYTFSSAGFGICALATIGQDYSFNIPLACYLPRVMRQKNIQDALDLLKQVASGLGYYHLADANGEIYGIESIHNDFEIIYPEKDLLLHSNHYITERFQKGDTAHMYQPDSYHRLETIKDFANQHYGHFDPEIAMEILADHNHHPDSICRHINQTNPLSSVTLASFIMVPEEGAIYIACGNPCEYEFVRYEF
ncbi:MAG: C45 family autoproteolytic acyltransferase/hydrolase [candidate division Zixibacteria bacterium]|nr:C45 family autoproteolytic acyltransferase/hydrolase [candidate division Zixibacteria bacterium]